ncbi:MAG: ABC transporter permease subunit [Candidatus Lokiarchaeota archaeon]|nr:ABC transporter permease subunit [Candidatus Lokiarchaeota archaeon]
MTETQMNKYKQKTTTRIPTRVKNDVSPVLMITKKTFLFNLCTIKRFLISLLIMVIGPIFMYFFVNRALLTESSSLMYTQGLILFFYTYGLVFPIIIGVSAAPLIAEERNSGTLLTLVSKPMAREGIIIGKFIALFVFCVLLSLASITIVTIIGLLIWPFRDAGAFFLVNFIYSLIIIVFFGGLTTGLSALFKKSRNAMMFPILIIVFSFLIGLIIKQMLMWTVYGGETSLYEQFQLYHFDISYHMANIYTDMVDLIIPGVSDSWGFFLLMFGAFKLQQTYICGSSGQYCYQYAIPVPSNYYTPILSMVVLLLIGILVLVAGTIYLKKKDITG